mmetsp:Transcript_60978/g.174840  ORF Transcript_60978/g.174840 Transcript_60978/m.174840 type:complete len:342 (-) Transcript_60978:144-1169(-)
MLRGCLFHLRFEFKHLLLSFLRYSAKCALLLRRQQGCVACLNPQALDLRSELNSLRAEGDQFSDLGISAGPFLGWPCRKHSTKPPTLRSTLFELCSNGHVLGRSPRGGVRQLRLCTRGRGSVVLHLQLEPPLDLQRLVPSLLRLLPGDFKLCLHCLQALRHPVLLHLHTAEVPAGALGQPARVRDLLAALLQGDLEALGVALPLLSQGGALVLCGGGLPGLAPGLAAEALRLEAAGAELAAELVDLGGTSPKLPPQLGRGGAFVLGAAAALVHLHLRAGELHLELIDRGGVLGGVVGDIGLEPRDRVVAVLDRDLQGCALLLHRAAGLGTDPNLLPESLNL